MLRASRQADVDPRAVRIRMDGEGAAERLDPLFEHDRPDLQRVEAHVIIVPLKWKSSTIVGDGDEHLAILTRYGHACLGGGGVSGGVHQRFLDDEADRSEE